MPEVFSELSSPRLTRTSNSSQQCVNFGIIIQFLALPQAPETVSFHTCMAGQPLANYPKWLPPPNSALPSLTMRLPLLYFSALQHPASSEAWNSNMYLPSELIKITFQLEPHHFVPKWERAPRHKARATVGLIIFLHSRIGVLWYLSLPGNNKDLISYVNLSILTVRRSEYFVRFHSVLVKRASPWSLRCHGLKQKSMITMKLPILFSFSEHFPKMSAWG